MRMHQNGLIENEECLKSWEWYLRTHIFQKQQFSLVTRVLHTYPKKKKTSVILHKMFPVLEKATLSTINPDFVPQRSEIDALGNVQMHFVSTFDTQNHGKVHMIGISILHDVAVGPNQCKMQLGAIAASDDDGLPAAGTKDPELTISMTNNGKVTDIHLFFATLVIPFTGCRLCRSMGDSCTTRTRMPKCSRCWSRLQFPVWYCSSTCQHTDFERHRDGCGRVV